MKEIKKLITGLHDRLNLGLNYQELLVMLNHSGSLHRRILRDLRTLQEDMVNHVPFLQDADVTRPESFGQCGDTVYWKLRDCVLYIGGTGDMWDFQNSFYAEAMAPWYLQYFNEVVISDGVTSIGAWAFEDASLKTIAIPPSVTEIRTAAFFNAAIDVLTLPDTIRMIHEDIIAADPCRVSELVLSCNIPYIVSEAFYIRYGCLDKITLTGSMPEDLSRLVNSQLFRFVPGRVLYPRSWDTPEYSFPDLLCAAIEEGDELVYLREKERNALRQVMIPYDA